MDSCITGIHTFKPFVCFLFFAVALIGLAIIPLVSVELAAITEIRAATWGTEWMQERWWRHWYSWAGGPVYRYSLRVLRSERRMLTYS